MTLQRKQFDKQIKEINSNIMEDLPQRCVDSFYDWYLVKKAELIKRIKKEVIGSLEEFGDDKEFPNRYDRMNENEQRYTRNKFRSSQSRILNKIKKEEIE